MPHPLGRIIERFDERTATPAPRRHTRLLDRKANESLFKPFREATRKARTELVQAGG